MSNGGTWNLCSRHLAKAEGAREPTTAIPLTASCTSCAPAAAGRTCHASTALLQPAGGGLRPWEGDGTWERIWRSLLALLDELGKLEWAAAFLDGSFVPAKKEEMG